MSELVINSKENEIEIGILEENRVCEYYDFDTQTENVTGNIYLGIIKNVVDGMQAAFVDIGMSKNAFMSLKDSIPKVDITKEEQVFGFRISEVLKENQKILVQIKKEPQTEKGARVSTHITIAGNYVVLMPNVEIITISQKITDEKERTRLISIAKENLPNGFGMIFRTESENVEEDKIRKDMNELVKKWENIENRYKKSSQITVLYNAHELISKIGRELITKNISKIYLNDTKIYHDLMGYVSKKGLENKLSMELMEGKNVFDELGISSPKEEVQKKKIWLKNGGYIVIDKTEALTAIDVNSGKYVGNHDLESTALEVNREAAFEIMRQIRLRDISGIVVVDYIDLQDKEDQAEIVAIMEQEGLKDRSKIDIKGYTKLNLVELTRKKSNL